MCLPLEVTSHFYCWDMGMSLDIGEKRGQEEERVDVGQGGTEIQLSFGSRMQVKGTLGCDQFSQQRHR